MNYQKLKKIIVKYNYKINLLEEKKKKLLLEFHDIITQNKIKEVQEKINN